jgi:alkylation response protein AidB-like acyl-CoA dehydrogenase
MNPKKNTKPDPASDTNLAEEVLRQSGKGKVEVDAVGTIDRADEVFEETLAQRFRTSESPVAKGVFGHSPLSLFAPMARPEGFAAKPEYLAVMANCIDIVAAHEANGTLFDEKEKISDATIADLSAAGYFGLLIDPEFGGQGVLLSDFMPFITEMAAKGDATTAGLASIHGCIGAVDPLIGFGTDDQKKRFLPKLASGEALSAFALTEPNAGSDLTQLRTTAVLDGNDYVVNGRKLFISNIRPGRTIGLVAMIDGKHAVLIVDLPGEENEHFQLDKYEIHAVRHIYNYGIVFNNLRVPKENLLVPPVGDGLTVAYHGLNRGRIALCANASGVMRTLLAAMLPWADYRKTYGDKIGNRELVQRRVAHTASRIVGADALVAWCSSLLDQGYRGELECIIAKVFGSESLKEVAIEDALKTLGGRSLLKGSIVGDNLHDLMAPMIYEGEGEVLAMAFFKGLIKDPGNSYMGPVMAAMSAAGVEMKYLLKFRGAKTMAQVGKLLKPRNLLRLVRASMPMLGWVLRTETRFGDFQSVSEVNPKLRGHAKFALKNFTRLAKRIERAMLKYQVALADRQLMMVQLSMAVQRTVTMLAACQYATEKGDETTILAADVLCRDLTMQLVGGLPDDGYFRACTKLARLVTDGKFTQLAGVPQAEILRKYSDK